MAVLNDGTIAANVGVVSGPELIVWALDPRPVAQFLAPPSSESKQRRIRLLVMDLRPEIRESAALHIRDDDVLHWLATDGKRVCGLQWREIDTAPAIHASY